MESPSIATRADVLELLESSHAEFGRYIRSLDERSFNFSKEGKWNAGQEMVHISRGIAALNKALKIPKVTLPTIFGRANRPSRSYRAMVDRYLEKAGKAGRKTIPAYEPEEVFFEDREALLRKYDRLVGKMLKRAARFSESQLDEFILPHPILGKLTLREMFGFMSYHVLHHKANSERNLREIS